MHTQTKEQKKLLFNMDIIRALLMGRIAKSYYDEVLSWEKAPKAVQVHAQAAISAILKTERSVLTQTGVPATVFMLDDQTTIAKLNDFATVLEMMAKIGLEENTEIYEEFFGIMIDCISAVLYAQKNRKNIHFSKYKALFKLFCNEVKADVDRQPGQIWYQNGSVYFRSEAPEIKSQLPNV